ncbi:MAG TPA: endolytic transglycosylase MltG [Actinospica sp.]|jgi:UPF0755 protein|nr:endolytic transglycosylase MltG [Actinospica sp.]
MSDGGWYGYPPQEPDPYSQPQDYGNAPQASGYDEYGRPTQPNPQHQQYYQQQQQQAAQQPQQPDYQQQQQSQQQPYTSGEYQQRPRQQAPQQPQQGQGQPQYRQQQRPPQRPRPQGPPPQQAQNPYFQQQQQQQGYGQGQGQSYGGGYEGYGQQQGYDTGGYPRQDYERSGYDTSTGYAGQGYDSAASYDAASYGSGSYDTGSTSRGGYDQTAQQSSAQTQSYGTRSQPSYSGGGARDPYSDLADLTEEPDEYEYPSPSRRRRSAGTGEQPQVTDDGRFGLLSESGSTGIGTGSGTKESSRGTDDDDDDEDGGRRKGGRSGGRDKDSKKARHSCTVIFLFFALIAGGLGYGVYQGYNWYESHYGPPADYSSATGDSDTAIVTVPSSASGTQIATLLVNAGVVKSERAFIDACNANSKCPDIQADTYQLHKQMSAAGAVTALLNTSNVYNKSQLLVKPGERAADVFADLEQKTGWTQAQIVSAVNSGQIDLPSYANAKAGTKYPFANIEGLLFTGTYQLPSYKTPTALLKAMVDQQLAMFNAVGLTQKASAVNMTPYQVLIVASMARAEAGSDATDLAKISGVIYNRLKNYSYSKLGFDTATLYGLGRTEPQPTAAELADKSNPYNLRVVRGLPPGPINSVDQTALMGALSPSDSTDVYFCAVNGTIHYASNDTSWAQLGKQYPGYCG